MPSISSLGKVVYLLGIATVLCSRQADAFSVVPFMSSRLGPMASNTKLHVSTSDKELAEKFHFLTDNPVANTLGIPTVDVDRDMLAWGAVWAVPIIWGTYVPCVRMLYDLDPAVPGFVFAAMYFPVAAITSTILAAREETTTTTNQTMEQDVGFWGSLPLMGGLEVGSYMFFGNCLQVMGLTTISADRAGFLVQLSTVFVPLVEAIIKGNFLAVSPTTWAACALALTGIGVMGCEEASTAQSLGDMFEASSSMLSGIGSGDLLTVGAAFLYSLSIIRVGSISVTTTPIKLTAAKTTFESIWSFVLLAALVPFATSSGEVVSDNAAVAFLQSQGNELLHYFHTMHERFADSTLPVTSVVKTAMASLYTGVVATAFLVFAQSYGQQRVAASEANVVYSLQPLFTAIFASLILGENMSTVGYVGGALIAGAVCLEASKDAPEEEI